MEYGFRTFVFYVQLVLIVIKLCPHFSSATIGVTYGMVGDNLPKPSEVVELCENNKIKLLRLFEPHPAALEALRYSFIKVAVGVRNSDIHDIVSSVDVAEAWVKQYIVPYIEDVDIKWIVVGNDMIPGSESISIAMNNILSGINLQGLTNHSISITTAISTKTLKTIFPPSKGDFSDDIKGLLRDIVVWLRGTNNPIFIDVETYFVYSSKQHNMSLSFALGTASEPEVIDVDYSYYTLFETMLDAFHAALEKLELGAGDIPMVMSKSGWPSVGDAPSTSIENARTYNQKVIDIINLDDTQRRISEISDVFIFSLFNENKKASLVEQNYGIFYPNKNPVYTLNFESVS